MGFFLHRTLNRDSGGYSSGRLEKDTKRVQIYSCGSILPAGAHEGDGDVFVPEHEPGMSAHLKEVKSSLASDNLNP